MRTCSHPVPRHDCSDKIHENYILPVSQLTPSVVASLGVVVMPGAFIVFAKLTVEYMKLLKSDRVP